MRGIEEEGEFGEGGGLHSQLTNFVKYYLELKFHFFK